MPGVPGRFRVVPTGSGRFRLGSSSYIHPGHPPLGASLPTKASRSALPGFPEGQDSKQLPELPGFAKQEISSASVKGYEDL